MLCSLEYCQNAVVTPFVSGETQLIFEVAVIGLRQFITECWQAFQGVFSSLCGENGVCLNITTGIFASLFVVIFMALLSFLWSRLNRRTRHVFLSIPMAGLEHPQGFETHKDLSVRLTEQLERIENVEVYCGYSKVTNKDEYQKVEAAPVEILKAIRKCSYFIAILSERVYTGTLVEIGYALARRKHVIIWYKTEGGKPNLPWILDLLGSNTLLRLRLSKQHYDDFEDLIRRARQDPAAFLNANIAFERDPQ